MTLETVAPPPVLSAPTSAGRWRFRSRWVLPGALLCLALWAVSLSDVQFQQVGGWGLLTALPVLWYVAFAGILLLYLAALLSQRRVGHSLAACHGVLIAILYATTSATYVVPRLPYTYKHIGVVEYLLNHGTVDRSIDIYQNFPGFFYLVAFVHRVTFIPVQDMALWAQPFFALVDAAAVWWLAGALSTSRRVKYGTALLFTLGDWVGQNYFSPQAAAFPVALFVLGGLLRSVPADADGARWGWHARLRGAAGSSDPQPSPFWGSPWGAVVLVVAFAYTAVSHQITPPILILQAVIICLALRPARPWLPVVFATIEAGWLALAWPYLRSHYDLFNFSVHNASPPQMAAGRPLPGVNVAKWAAPSLMAVVALLTLAGLVMAVRHRRVGRLIVPTLVGVAPVLVLALQPYGQEAIFRVYLFGLPWACLITASWLFGERRAAVTSALAPGLRRRSVAATAAVAMAVLLLPAMYAGELTSRVAPSDVAAEQWFEQHTPAGSLLLPLTPDYPLWSTGNYYSHLPSDADQAGTLMRLPGFTKAAASRSGALAFIRTACAARAQGGQRVYIPMGPYAQNYVELYGVVPMAQYRADVQALRSDPRFTPVFSQGSSVLLLCS